MKPLSFYNICEKKVMIYPEPYGVVLVIGAWNYPLQVPESPHDIQVLTSSQEKNIEMESLSSPNALEEAE